LKQAQIKNFLFPHQLKIFSIGGEIIPEREIENENIVLDELALRCIYYSIYFRIDDIINAPIVNTHQKHITTWQITIN